MMLDIFNQLELLRIEFSNRALKLKGQLPVNDYEMLANDIHRLRGRLMQIAPNGNQSWQNVRGLVQVKVE